MKENKKETQGHRKMKQYIEDLKRNKYFLKDLKKYTSSYEKDKKNNKDGFGIFMSLFEEYLKLADIIKRGNKKNKTLNIKNKITEKYHLDYRLFSEASYPSDSKYPLGEDPYGEVDICYFRDNYDENFSPFDNYIVQKLPLIMRPNDKDHITAYPMSIDIHLFATKRDVLDFVEKKWHIMGDILSSYREKKVRFRARKHPRDLLDCIWENRNLEANKIKPIINKKFPNNGLAYWEIHKIISNERKKRMLKITVGQ